jgi:hypothetical protein
VSQICWSCGTPDGLEQDHGDSGSITTYTLQRAADSAGIDIPHVISNLVLALSHYDPKMAKSVKREVPLVGCDVFKSVTEQRYTLGVAYPANKADVGKAADGFQDFVGPDVLEKAAWSFMRKGAKVGLDHREGTDGAGEVVESYIYRGPDWPQDNGYVVKAGDWLLGVCWPPRAWTDIKSGIRNGYSPQGGARRRRPTPEALAALRS